MARKISVYLNDEAAEILEDMQVQSEENTSALISRLIVEHWARQFLKEANHD